MPAKKKKRVLKKKSKAMKKAKKKKAAPKRRKAKAMKKGKVKKTVKAVGKKMKKGSARKTTIAKKAAAATAEKILGRVTHYYDRIGVAIIDLKEPLRLGEIVRIKHGEHEMLQPVTSMQINHQQVSAAGKKDVIGIKVMEKVSEGSLVLPV